MIEVRDLKKKFGAQQVLNGVSFRIEPGDSVVIIGGSGCGKSVLLKHLIGLIRPDSGEIIIDEDHLNEMDERRLLEVRRKFGMLFQSAALFDSLNVAVFVRTKSSRPPAADIARSDKVRKFATVMVRLVKLWSEMTVWSRRATALLS